MALRLTVHRGYGINVGGAYRGVRVYAKFRRCERWPVPWSSAHRLQQTTGIMDKRDPEWTDQSGLIEAPDPKSPSECSALSGLSLQDGFEIKLVLAQVDWSGTDYDVAEAVLVIKKANATAEKERVRMDSITGRQIGVELMVSWQVDELDDKALKRAEQEKAEKLAAQRLYNQSHGRSSGSAAAKDTIEAAVAKLAQEDAEHTRLRKQLKDAVSAENWADAAQLSTKLQERQKVLEREEAERRKAEEDTLRHAELRRRECVPDDACLEKLGAAALRELATKVGLEPEGDPSLLRTILRKLRDDVPPPATGPSDGAGAAAAPSASGPLRTDKTGDDSPGVYRILKEVDVTETIRSREAVRTLQQGEVVRVSEVVPVVECHRIRARIVTPCTGWISLVDSESKHRWAERDQDAWKPHQGAAQLGVALAAAAAAARAAAPPPPQQPAAATEARKVPRYREGGLVKAARRIDFESGKVVEKGAIGEVLRVPGSPAQVRVGGVLFTADDGDVEPIALPDAGGAKGLAGLPKGIAKEAAERDRLARAKRVERFTEGGLVRTLRRLEFESGKVLEAGEVGEAVRVPGVPATVRFSGLVFAAHGDGDVEPYEPPTPLQDKGAAASGGDAVVRAPLTAAEQARLEELLADADVRAVLGAAAGSPKAAKSPGRQRADPREAVPLRRIDESPSKEGRGKEEVAARRRHTTPAAASPTRRGRSSSRSRRRAAAEAAAAEAPPAEARLSPRRSEALPRARVGSPGGRAASFHVIVVPAGEAGVEVVVRDVALHDSVLALKRRVEQVNGVPPLRQCLLQHTPGGSVRRLDDRWTLAAYGITPGERLTLTAAQGRLPLTLRTPQGRTLRLAAQAEETVLALKQKVHALANIPISRQLLFVAGEEMADRRTLAQSGVTAGAVIDLHERHGATHGKHARSARAARGAPIRVCVIDEAAGPRGAAVMLEAAAGDTVEALKRQIAARVGVGHQAFVLTHNGVRMGEGLRLRECGLRDAAQVRMQYLSKDLAGERAGVAEMESRVEDMRRSVVALTDRSDGLARAVEQMASRMCPAAAAVSVAGYEPDLRTAELLDSCRDLRQQLTDGVPSRHVAAEGSPARRSPLVIPPDIAADLAAERERAARAAAALPRSATLAAPLAHGSPPRAAVRFASPRHSAPPGGPVPLLQLQSPPRITVSPPTARGSARAQTAFEQRLELLRELHAKEREGAEQHSTIARLTQRLGELDGVAGAAAGAP